jgi:hypothetical protein
MTTLSHPSRLYLPRRRAASLRQVLMQRAERTLRGLWQALEAAGQRRAAPELLAQADILESSHPALAESLRELASRDTTRPLTPAATAARTR